MNFIYSFTIPASTSASSPYEQNLKLSYGVITNVQIVLPVGHQAKAHLVMLFHGFQIYPLSRGNDYHGDDVSFQFDDRFFINSAPYEIKARGWNTDTDYNHEFIISIAMLLPEQLGLGTGVSALRDVQSLTGKSIEV
jgi:hypothetical protein